MKEEYHSNQLFDGIDRDCLDALDLEPAPLEFQPGEVIFREGEPGSSFYLITEGTVRISKGDGEESETLGLIGAGDFIGEMAVIDGKLRSAAATAEGTCRLGEIDTDGFEAGDNWGQRLFFNQNGERACLTGQRTSDFLAEGDSEETGE